MLRRGRLRPADAGGARRRGRRAAHRHRRRRASRSLAFVRQRGRGRRSAAPCSRFVTQTVCPGAYTLTFSLLPRRRGRHRRARQHLGGARLGRGRCSCSLPWLVDRAHRRPRAVRRRSPSGSTGNLAVARLRRPAHRRDARRAPAGSHGMLASAAAPLRRRPAPAASRAPPHRTRTAHGIDPPKTRRCHRCRTARTVRSLGVARSPPPASPASSALPALRRRPQPRREPRPRCHRRHRHGRHPHAADRPGRGRATRRSPPATKAYFDYVNDEGRHQRPQDRVHRQGRRLQPGQHPDGRARARAGGRGLRDPQRPRHPDAHRRARLPERERGARPVRRVGQPQLEPAGEVPVHVRRTTPTTSIEAQDRWRTYTQDELRRQEGLLPRPGRRLRRPTSPTGLEQVLGDGRARRDADATRCPNQDVAPQIGALKAAGCEVNFLATDQRLHGARARHRRQDGVLRRSGSRRRRAPTTRRSSATSARTSRRCCSQGFVSTNYLPFAGGDDEWVDAVPARSTTSTTTAPRSTATPSTACRSATCSPRPWPRPATNPTRESLLDALEVGRR